MILTLAPPLKKNDAIITVGDWNAYVGCKVLSFVTVCRNQCQRLPRFAEENILFINNTYFQHWRYLII